MLSRRELFTAGVAGSLGTLPESGAPVAPEEGHKEIAREIDSLEGVLRSAYLSPSLSHGVITKLRSQMELFLKGTAKFPDYIEVGIGVFMEVYDWHIKYRQQLAVTRAIDGRYHMQFMFTVLILRPEHDPGYIGIPFDKV